MKKSAAGFFKNYNPTLDRKVFATLLDLYHKGLDPALQPAIFGMVDQKYRGNFETYANDVFGKSIFASTDKLIAFLNRYKVSKYKSIEKDPAFQLAQSIYNLYYEHIQHQVADIETHIDSMQRIYMKGLMEFQPKRQFYPDANSTLRIAYGKVDDYAPADGVHYNYFTTLEGIMQKENPDIYDYVVEPKLK